MKKFILSIFIALSLPGYLFARTVKISDLKDVIDVNCSNALLLFDIHDTLVHNIFKKNVDFVKSEMKAGKEFSAFDRFIKYKWVNVVPTQEDVPSIVQNLQKRCSVFALTAADCQDRDYVLNQLFQVGVNFSGALAAWSTNSANNVNNSDTTCFKSQILNSKLSCDFCFKDGVIFSGWGLKSKKPAALESFMRHFNLVGVKKVILVDDSLKNHQFMQEWCDFNGIEYLGFYYVK